MKKSIFLSLVCLFGLSLISVAQDNAADLAKKLANPISSLISVPFQNNSDYGIGEFNGSRNTLNFQPVVPIKINENLNLISRAVIPIISQYNITGRDTKQSGIGDAVVSAFFSPSKSEKLTWGIGPALLLPIGTNEFLTGKKFGMGPTAVALKQINGITIGALINQIWSVAGAQDRADISQMFIQPFFNYNWPSGAGIGGNFEFTQNWKASTTTVWFNPTISGVTSLGKQKTQLAIGPRINLAAPDGGKADWGWRASAVFLFPK